MPPPIASPEHTVHVLYQDYHRWLQHWLYRKVGCPHQAADLTQDTFVREAIEILDRLLDGLPLRVRKVFLMNRLEEMTHVEIARALSISVATVERDMKRALTHCYLTHLDAIPPGAADSPQP